MSYDVFLLAGQSNAVGRGQTLNAAQDAVVVEGVKQWDTTTQSVIDAVNPLRNFDPTTTVGFAYRFAVLYKQATGRDVLIVPRAKGGSGFANNGWGTGKVYHEGAITQANAALAATGGKLKGILWHQGESDANVSNSAATYQANLSALVQDFRTRITGAGSALFICGGMTPLIVAGSASHQAIQGVLASVATFIDRSAFVTSDGLGSNSTSDAVHFSAAAQREFAERYLDVYQDLKYALAFGNDDRTGARGYQKPSPINLLSTDVLRLREALESIDLDITKLFELTAMKNYPDIRPSLLLDFANSGYLDPRLSITRATPGAYVTVDGRIALAAANEPRFELDFAIGESRGLRIQPSRTNLALYSEEFDNAYWTKQDVTITANADTAPDGTLTADKIVESSASANRYVARTFSLSLGVRYSFSVYLKSAGRNIARVYTGTAAGGVWANVNLAIGEIIATSAASGANLQAAAQKLGNGWVRVSISMTAVSSGASDMRVTPLDADYSAAVTNGTPYLGDGSSGVFAWGMQFEVGAAPSSYIKTTTASATRAADVVTSSNLSWFNSLEGSFFIDGAAENSLLNETGNDLVSNGSAFDNAAWTKTNTTVTANNTTAPDSTLTADKVVETTALSGHDVRQTLTFVSSITYSLSVYAKAAERSRFSMIVGGAASGGGFFNLQAATATDLTGSAPGRSATITSVGDGWYLCTVLVDVSTLLPSTFRIYLASSVTAVVAPSYTGDGTSGMFFWGAEVRPVLASLEDGILLSLDSGAQQNLIEVGINSYRVLAPGTTTAASMGPDSPAYVAGTARKLAAAYKQDDFVFRASDGNSASDTSGAVLTAIPTTMRIGGSQAGRFMNGYIRRIAYYPKRIPNLELDSLLS
jgi:hypothetical protein